MLLTTTVPRVVLSDLFRLLVHSGSHCVGIGRQEFEIGAADGSG